ncbi:GtrA family protein [Actinospica durhamensis]|uniref:GtrA family protein n=2 Tax=Actinospica durhamensis TaxID=1508375 RepID=A0A941ES98_9ACTN|nr:GtrA family protein [Actinospica durhamensis]
MTEMIVAAVRRKGVFLRYTAGSLIATVCSEVALFVAYAVFDTGAQVASILAWVAGAVPNYVLNRLWAWKKQDGERGMRQAVIYWGVTVATAALAVLVTDATDGLIRSQVSDRIDRAVLLDAAYLATYAVAFVVKFVVFDKWVFGRARGEAPDTVQGLA